MWQPGMEVWGRIDICMTESLLCSSETITTLSVNPKVLIYPLPPPTFPFGNHACFLCLWVYFWFVNKFICIILLDSTYKWYRMLFVILCLTSLSMIISRSIHVAANGIISLFFYGWVILHCVYAHLYPFICWWHLGCFPVLAIVK